MRRNRSHSRQCRIKICFVQDKEDLLSKTAKSSSNQHVSVTKKTLSLFGYPYFKDIQMYHPPPNKVGDIHSRSLISLIFMADIMSDK